LKGKTETLSVFAVFCAALNAKIVHSAVHAHEDLTVLWIGFCLTRPILLCMHVFCVSQ